MADPTDFRPLERIAPAHRAPIWSVALTTLADGRVMLASCGDNAVRLWDTETGLAYGDPLLGHAGAVRCVAGVSLPDGSTLLASGGVDGTVRLWDPNTGNRLDSFAAGGPVWSVAFGTLSDGRTVLAAGSDDSTVMLWDLSTHSPLGEPLRGHALPVLAVAFGTLSDGRRVLASGSKDGTIGLWFLESAEHHSWTGHSELVSSLDFTTLPDGRVVLASCGLDGTVGIWDADDGGLVRRIPTGDSRVWSVAFSNPFGDEVLLASGGDGAVRLWDATSGRPVHDPLGDETMVALSVAFGTRPDGRPLLVSGGRDGSVRMWDPTTGGQEGDSMVGHGCAVRSMVACGGGTDDERPLFISGGDDGTVRLWGPSTGRWHGKPLVGHSDSVLSVACTALPSGGTMIASGSADGTVRRWDCSSGEPIGDPITGHDGPVLSVAFLVLPDGRTLLAGGGNDGTVRVWDAVSGIPVGQPLSCDTQPVQSVACLHADGRPLLASGSRDGTVRIWDPLTGDWLNEFRNGQNEAWSVALVAAGNQVLLASGGGGTVQLRNLHGDIARLHGHKGPVRSVAFTPLPDGRPLLVSGSDDHCVRLWEDPTNSRDSRVLNGHGSPVGAVALVPRPGALPLLLTGDEDGGIQVWGGESDGDGWTQVQPHSEPIRPYVPVLTRTEALIAGDDTATEDTLGREVLAGHLHVLLGHLANRSVGDDSQGTAVVHVDGRWGSGKSTLVTLLCRRFRQSTDGRESGRGSLTEPIVVPYDAWRESAIAPEWWSLATTINRAVRGERAGATRLVMSLSHAAIRLVSSRPALTAVGLLGLAVVARVAGLWRNASEVSGWLTALIAVVAAGLSAGRVLFWTSPTFGKLYLKSDGNPLDEIAKIISRLRRWSPRAGRPHRLADTLCFLWTLVTIVISVRLLSHGDGVGPAAAGAGTWLVGHWPLAMLTLAAATAVWTGWRRSSSPVEPEPEARKSPPTGNSGAAADHDQWSLKSTARSVWRVFRAVAVLRTASRFLCLGAAAAATLASWAVPLPAVAVRHPGVFLAGLPLVGLAGYALWTRGGRARSRRPLVLVIDDLDRCTMDRAVKLLETVHTLFRRHGAPRLFPRWRAPARLIVLVLADGRWLKAAFESNYQQFSKLGSAVHGLGADFLQKLFDHTVLVPALSDGQVRRLLGKITEPLCRQDEPLRGEPAPAASPEGKEKAAYPPSRPNSQHVKEAAFQTIEHMNPGHLRSAQVNAMLSNRALTVEDAVEVETRRVEREAGEAATAERATHLLATYAAIMPTNPRLIKRVATTLGMLWAVQSQLHAGQPTAIPPEDHLVRAAIMFVMFPSLIDDLLSCADAPSIDQVRSHRPQPDGSPWLRPDVQRLLTTARGQIHPADIAHCYGRQFPRPSPSRTTNGTPRL